MAKYLGWDPNETQKLLGTQRRKDVLELGCGFVLGEPPILFYFLFLAPFTVKQPAKGTAQCPHPFVVSSRRRPIIQICLAAGTTLLQKVEHFFLGFGGKRSDFNQKVKV